MPRETTIRPPSFNEFENTGQTFTETQGTSFDGTTAAQHIIFESVWATFFGFSLVLSLIIGVGIIYAMMRVRQIRSVEARHYANQPLSSAARRVFDIEDASVGSVHSSRWQSVIEHANSESPNDWRQAILEADVMLDDAITSRGYAGEGLGEKMKQISRSDINSIDDAWEAHKIRNRIAHEGSNFELTKRETRRTVDLYERIFRELGHM